MYNISVVDFNKISFVDFSCLSFWANPKLLEAFAIRDNLKLSWITVYKKNELVMIMPVFEKKKLFFKYLSQLDLYYYTPISFFLKDKKYSFENENEKLSVLNSLAGFLSKNYIKTQLALESVIQDVRGFIWNGFNCFPAYTYVKDMYLYNRQELYPKQKRYLKKALSENLNVSLDWKTEVIVELSRDMLKRKNRSHQVIFEKSLRFYQQLHKEGLCFQITAFRDEQPLAFRLILKNEKDSYLYDFLAGASKEGNNIGANIFCLDYIFSNYNKLFNNISFRYFDFCGANTQTVAYFKSQFDNHLVNYYRIKKSI